MQQGDHLSHLRKNCSETMPEMWHKNRKRKWLVNIVFGKIMCIVGIIFLIIGILVLANTGSVFDGLVPVAGGCIFIVIGIKSITGTKRTLQDYMRGLPYYVKDIVDVKKLFKKSGDSMIFSKEEIAKSLELIGSDEPIYLMAAPTVTITDKTGTKINSKGLTPGVVFISNKRFVFIESTSNEVYEIPLYGIRSVAAKSIVIRDGISFSTSDVAVKVSSGALHFQPEFVRTMLIELAATAQPPQIESENTKPASPQISEFTSSNQTAYHAKVVDCKGCGATVIVHYNVISRCEYCNRPVE